MPSKFVAALGVTLDARPDRVDLRDREFAPPVASLPARFPDDATLAASIRDYVRAGLVLHQGNEGACTGFGLACVVNYLLWRRAPAAQRARKRAVVSMRMLYHLARFYDEWPGEDYDGSSCRGALKGWHKHGVCADALWPYRTKDGRVAFIKPRPGWQEDAATRRLGVYYRIDKGAIADMQAAIFQIGAIYVSADAHDGWDLPGKRRTPNGHAALAAIGALRDPESLGGHAFALVGYNERGFVVQNSWGREWGSNGFATLPYAEWTRRGADAWVCALGVPGDATLATSIKLSRPRHVLATTNTTTFTTAPKAAPSRVDPAVAPWSTELAYGHAVVMDNDGRVVNRIVTHESGPDGVRELVVRAPLAWFDAGDSSRRANASRRIAIYAHGGLNDEQGSIDRIRVLAPYFAANGIYPLFITWKTGAVETLTDLIDDQLQRIPRPDAGVGDWFDRIKDTAIDAFDRTIEVVAGPVVKPIWSQMKQNAAAAAEPGRGSALIASALNELAARTPGLEIHFVGHSAGSILLGHLLDALDPALRVATCSLYAPACTVAFALEHYAAARRKLARAALHVHVLSDRRELDDTVGPYQKSLLYLVSRALEADHKTPILGLAKAFDPHANGDWHDRTSPPSLPAWQAYWGGTDANLHVLDAAHVSSGPLGKAIKASHGCFDNDAATIEATLARILGAPPRFTVESLDY